MSQSSAWKDLERRVCRALGVERRPSIGPGGYARGSDDDGNCFAALEVKRTKRLQLRASWLAQARKNGKASSRPWLLVIGTHGSSRLVAVLDFYVFAQICQEAGRLGEIPIAASEGGHMLHETTQGEPDVPAPPTEPPPEDEGGEDAGT